MTNHRFPRFAAGVLLFAAGAVFAENPEDSLKFSAPLQTSADAVLAEGSPKGEVRGKLQFTAGMGSEKALQGGKGGASIVYAREENLDLDTPGTITFWFKIDCEHGAKGPAITFCQIGSSIDKGILSLQVVNDPMTVCPCRRQIGFMFFSKARRHKAYMVGTGSRRICSGWHLLSGGWAGNRLYVSLDGTPYKSFELATPVSNQEFSYIKRFGVAASSAKWNFAMSDFRIYGKRLSDAEIRSVYEAGMKKLSSPATTK